MVVFAFRSAGVAVLTLACSSNDGPAAGRDGGASALPGRSEGGTASDGSATPELDGAPPASENGENGATPGVGLPLLWRRLAVGRSHACAITQDRRVDCWRATTTTEIPRTGEFDAVATLQRGICARTVDRRVVCWRRSELEDETPDVPLDDFAVQDTYACGIRASDSRPVCWGGEPPPGLEDSEPLTQIGIGALGFACGISQSDSTVRCWIEPTDSVSNTREIIMRDIPTGPQVQLSVGEAHACVVNAEQIATCWGSDFHGSTHVPDGRYVQVAAGDESTCALTTEREIVCWGAGWVMDEEPPEGRFLQIAAGRDIACAVHQDGRVSCWGRSHGGIPLPEDLRVLID